MVRLVVVSLVVGWGALGLTSPLPAFGQAGGSPLMLELRADRAVYARGDLVELTMVVTNRGSTPVSLTAPSTQLYDFRVMADGVEVWRWSADQMFATVLTLVTIPPGESRRFTEGWDQRDREGRPVPPGQYVVVGTLVVGDRLGLLPQHLPLTIR